MRRTPGSSLYVFTQPHNDRIIRIGSLVHRPFSPCAELTNASLDFRLEYITGHRRVVFRHIEQ